ncbi:VCBS repeat-containing protein [Flavivirga spongiicola]
MYKNISYLILAFILLASCNKGRSLHPNELIGGFDQHFEDKTGIGFNNAIKENDSLNHFFMMQVYNGAGVAIGDINNDGLSDIYFCGNQVNDRLYLNKGNFEFKDITETSGIAKVPGWSTGVTMADINADGLLDIYISRSGPSMRLKDRQNLLYINKGNNTFVESSKKFGLADYGFSSQALFFDMDNDNDLDMFQVNQPPDPRLIERNGVSKKRKKYYTDRLYRNDNGRFRNISEEAGINKLAYGLSVSASDFNNDGYIDLYVANDYDTPDYLYFNNGDGTFKNVINKSLRHISRFSMGSDAGDINNDGWIDISTLDMASEDHYRSKTNMGSMSTEAFNKIVAQGEHYQYMHNTLQLNHGNGQFSDVGALAGVGKTDWSWATLIADLDNDGWKDIVVSNGIKRDIRNNDFTAQVIANLKQGNTDYLSMSKTAPSVPMSNYIFKNDKALGFKNTSKDWGFDKPGFSNGMAYGDLDNDGDLDIVTNNMGSSAFVYENKATGNYLKFKFEGPKKNKFGYGTKVVLKQDDITQTNENIVTKGYLSSVESGVFFGLGKDTDVKEIEIIWPDGKTQLLENVPANQTITLKYNDPEVELALNTDVKPIFKSIAASYIGINFIHKEAIYNDFEKQTLLPHKLSQNGPFITVGDINNDGIEDFFIGGASGQSGVLYTQNKNGTFIEGKSQPWQKDKDMEDLGGVFIDIDNDNDLDLYVCSGSNEFEVNSKLLEDRLYVNTGNGSFIKSNNHIPKIYESTETVKVMDIDGDGDKDLFVGGRLIPGRYPFPAKSYFLINENGYFKDKTNDIAPALNNCGLITDATFTDFDKDGDHDLILVGEWMPITVLENTKGKFNDITTKLGLDKSQGMWWSITSGDIDNDGDDDYIIGNLGKNTKYKATLEKPFKIYANDFDGNGTNDVILAKPYKNDYVPLRGRECTSQQMPYVANKFKDYHSFASSKLMDILPKDKLEGAAKYIINSFESILLLNNNDHFIQKTLPIEAQVSPIKSSIITDANNDGFQDVFVFGNHYPVEVETVRYDAAIGLLMLGNGTGNLKSVSALKSGINIPYDSRDAQMIQTQNNKSLLLVTNNNYKPILLINN